MILFLSFHQQIVTLIYRSVAVVRNSLSFFFSFFLNRIVRNTILSCSFSCQIIVDSTNNSKDKDVKKLSKYSNISEGPTNLEQSCSRNQSTLMLTLYQKQIDFKKESSSAFCKAIAKINDYLRKVERTESQS